MESCTKYRKAEESFYAKRDGLGDDRSRTAKSNHLVWSAKSGKVVVREEHHSASRFQRIIHGNEVAPEVKSQHYWVACTACGGPKKVAIRRKQIVSLPQLVVSDCFESFSLRPINHPQMQVRFDEWMKEMTARPKLEPVKVPEAKPTKAARSRMPHHYYHHLKEKDQSQEDQKRQTGLKVCVNCPDPYRNWSRQKSMDHLYMGEWISLPIYSEGSEPLRQEVCDTTEKRLKEYIDHLMESSEKNVSELKTKLKKILKKSR